MPSQDFIIRKAKNGDCVDCIHTDDLMADWALAVDGKKPFPIRGLDQ